MGVAVLTSAISSQINDLSIETGARRLGEILIERGKLDQAGLERALRLQEGGSRERLGSLLITLGVVAQRHPTVPRASHMVTNHLIDFTVPDDAFVESWCLAIEQHPAAGDGASIDRV